MFLCQGLQNKLHFIFSLTGFFSIPVTNAKKKKKNKTIIIFFTSENTRYHLMRLRKKICIFRYVSAGAEFHLSGNEK